MNRLFKRSSQSELSQVSTQKSGFVGTIIAVVFLASSYSYASGNPYGAIEKLPLAIQRFIQWETRANGAGLRSNLPHEILHFEIPTSALGVDFSKFIEPKLQESLVFMKNGEPHFRWIVNPYDTKWKVELAAWLKKSGLDDRMYSYYTGYLTASRSLILIDPKTQYVFSAKVSTDNTGGLWKSRHLSSDDASQVRLADGYLLEEAVPIQPSIRLRNGGKVTKTSEHGGELIKVQDKVGLVLFDHFEVMSEPVSVHIGEIDQAMLVRSMEGLLDEKRYYLPGFSALHEEVGREIALKNGATNVANYWNENFNKPLARAYAEFTAHYGLTYDSPHSQNFLIELDLNMKPTGKIIFRDFGDTFALKQFFEALGENEFLRLWEIENIHEELNVAVGLLHGNDYPSWLNEAQYKEWSTHFYAEFEKTYSELTGIPISELRRVGDPWQSGRYFTKTYPTHSQSFRNYLNLAPCFQGHLLDLNKNLCPKKLLAKMRLQFEKSCKERINPYRIPFKAWYGD